MSNYLTGSFLSHTETVVTFLQTDNIAGTQIKNIVFETQISLSSLILSIVAPGCYVRKNWGDQKPPKHL